MLLFVNQLILLTESRYSSKSFKPTQEIMILLNF